MKITKKIAISLVIFGAIFLAFTAFIIHPLFNQLQKESVNLVLRKNRLAELEAQAKNLQKFQETRKIYQANLEKIDGLFVDSTKPIGFIEFLEKEAIASQLSIEIAPLTSKEMKDDVWPHMDFQLTLVGFFPDFLRFFEKVESSPYLIEVSNLNLRRLDEEIPGQLSASLLIKVYTK